MRLVELAEKYADQQDASPGYRDQLRWAVAALERHAGRPLLDRDLRPELITSYLAATKTDLAAWTRHNRRNMLVRLLDAQAGPRTRRRGGRPPVPPVRLPGVLVRAWSPDEVRRLLSAAGKLRGHYRHGPAKAAYWRAWILAAWDLGLRGCDLRRLSWAQIDERGCVRIRQAKTGRAYYGRLRPAALAALRLLPGDPPLRLWSRLAGWRTLARRLVADAGLPGHIGWLRHAAATACELAHPGRGYLFLGNTPEVFYRHYFDRAAAELPQPPEL